MSNPQALQPITESAKGELTGLLEQAVRNGLSDIFDYSTNLPGFVAGSTPASPPFQAVQGTIRQACRRWARGDGLVRGPGFDGLWGGICNPYLGSISEAPTTSSFFPPAALGQCVGVAYDWTAQATSGGSPSGPVRSGRANGPISVRGRQDGLGSWRWDVYSGSTAVQFLISGATQTVGGRLLSVTRVGGGPDDCAPSGEESYRPPLVVPGLPTLNPTPVGGPFGGPSPVDVTFDPDGNIQVTFPDLGIDFTVPNPLTQDEDGDSPGGQGEAGDETPSSEEPAEEEGLKNLVGVLVTVTDFPPRINTSQNPSETYYKGLYYVFFGGEAGYAMQQEAAIVRASQFFYAPEGCNRYRVVPNLGVTLKVRPFFKEKE